MTITSSGLRCDVCGKPIIPVLHDVFEQFTVSGIKRNLQCHMKCRKPIEDAGEDWEKLPEGPLKRTFKKDSEKPRKKD